MREIKFRAWDKERNRMSELPFNIGGTGRICGVAFFNNDLIPIEVIENEPNRYDIMQYTGLKDKNAKEIFEGDIIEIKYKNYPKFTGKVFWEAHFLCYMVTSPHSVFSCMHLNEYEDIKADGLSGVYKYNERKYKVIGNIYENQDLIK